MAKARNHANSNLGADREFAATRWSVVLVAGRRSSPDSRRALESLCEAYWYPLYAYVRRRVADVNDAHDLTQAFFSELLTKNYVGSAKAERGRFRAFLLTSLKHFLSKERERARAQKRGGGKGPIPLDFESADSRYRIEPARGLTAEQIYDREWAVALLGRILQRLEAESADAGKSEQFQELKGFLIGEHAGAIYADVAVRLSTSEAAVKMAASRLRRRYRELLREEIAETLSRPDDVDDEISKLFATLQL
ncbi:MAG TPA: sigma-70 family RNA polymerase sigma factor [Planctomycetaceae bacterium]|jgi:RNA polymerase sigma-70 factor (ECF subfamily)|nr:sigma-70 family RNA polymerase sigma factor [Planctomycetaceae bacterium]